MCDAPIRPMQWRHSTWSEDPFRTSGHINHSGEIDLLYVGPEARFVGVSSMLLEWLEAETARVGLNKAFLRSSPCGFIRPGATSRLQNRQPDLG